MTISLAEISATLRGAGMGAHVQGIGGNVYAVIVDGRTVTLNGGQSRAYGPTEALICDDYSGAEVWRGIVHTAAEIVPLLASIPDRETCTHVNVDTQRGGNVLCNLCGAILS